MPAPFVGPAFDNYFGLCVELHTVLTLRVQIAKETFVPAAEREIGDGRGDADVDADVPRVRFEPELARRSTITGEDTRHVAVGATINQRNRLFHALGVNQTEHWPENLRFRQLTIGCDVFQNRGKDPIAVLITLPEFVPCSARQ